MWTDVEHDASAHGHLDVTLSGGINVLHFTGSISPRSVLQPGTCSTTRCIATLVETSISLCLYKDLKFQVRTQGMGVGGAAMLQLLAPHKSKFKNTDFVHTMISNILRSLLFS